MENPYAIFQVKAVSNFQRFLLWLEIIILSQHKMGTLQLIQISLSSNVDQKENIPHGNVWNLRDWSSPNGYPPLGYR